VKDKETGLNERQMKFCELFVSEDFFGNGVQSYIAAYQIDITRKGAYEGARACASENLTKPNILKYINSLIDVGGFNEQNVDKQLLIVMQQNADYGAKVQAIREFNKLKTRITTKVDLNIRKLGKDLTDEVFE
jgi:phage terminase small subunit